MAVCDKMHALLADGWACHWQNVKALFNIGEAQRVKREIEIPEVLYAEEPPSHPRRRNRRPIISKYEYEKKYYTRCKDHVTHDVSYAKRSHHTPL
jgi:hypothetical protein